MKVKANEFSKSIARAVKNNNEQQLVKIIKRIYHAGMIDEKFPLSVSEESKKPEAITLLNYFIINNNTKIIKLLLEQYGANRHLSYDALVNSLALAMTTLHLDPGRGFLVIELLLAKDAKQQIDCQVGQHNEQISLVKTCVYYNKLTLLKFILKISANALFSGVDGSNYPIHDACSSDISIDNKRILLEELLQYEPERQVLLQGAGGFLPLHRILERGELALVPLLLKHAPEKQLLALNVQGMNALHLAARALDFYTLEKIVELKIADQLVNVTFEQHGFVYSPLIIAITPIQDQGAVKDESQVLKFVGILLGQGADVLVGENGLMAFVECCRFNYVDVAQLLLSQHSLAQLSAVTEKGVTPLISACLNGADKIVKYFLDLPYFQEKEVLLQTDKAGRTALYMAILGYLENVNSNPKKYEDVMRHLLRQHTSAQLLQKVNDCLPLHLAIDNNAKELVELLVSNEDCPEQYFECSNAGFTVIDVAAAKGNVDLLEIMLEHKPSCLTIEGKSGYTLLGICAYFNQLPMTKFIAQRLATQITRPDIDGLLPIHYAIKMASLELFNLYWHHPTRELQLNVIAKSGNSLEFTAVDSNNLNILTILLAEQKDCSMIYNKEGLNLLHYACAKGRVEIVRFLLTIKQMSNYVNAVTQDIHATTALHLAIESNFREIVTLLCQNHANLNSLDANGQSPIIKAAIMNKNSLVRLLLVHGADPRSCFIDKATGESISLLMIATDYENSKIISLLQKRIIETQPRPVDNNPEKETVVLREKLPSALSYLTSLGYTSEQIQEFKSRHDFSIAKLRSTPILKKISWCGAAFDNASSELIQVQISNQATPHYLYISSDIKSSTGFGDDFWQQFLNKRIRFSNSCIKKLSADKTSYSELIHFGNSSCKRDYEYEIKISKLDRILLFTLNSDDQTGCLLVAGRYLSGGLHTQAQISALEMSIRNTAGIKIAVPSSIGRGSAKANDGQNSNLPSGKMW